MAFLQRINHAYLVIFAADIIAFITGTSIAWSSPVIAILEGKDINKIPLGRQITDEEESWIGSMAAMGGIFGPFIFGYLVQSTGRKITVTVISIPYLVAYLLAAFAESVSLYYVSRILMGFGVGGMFCILPIFVVESVEAKNRGTLQATTTSAIMLGLLFSYSVGPYVSIMAFNLILAAFCVIYMPVFWFLAPETPYYLCSINQEEEAFKALSYLRQKPHNEVQLELEGIKEHVKQLKPTSFYGIFKTRGTVKAFVYSVVLTISQQFSGVTVILYFTQNIFHEAGSVIPPEVCSIIVGAVQFVVSTISPPFLDKVGKKLLLLIALAGTITCEIVLGVYFYLQKNGDDVSGISWLPILSLVVFIAFYNFGLGSIPWAVMGELLPLNIISKASVVVTSFYWLIGFFLTKYFGSLSHEIGMAGSFWLFGGICVLFELFVYFFMFETKGKSLNEIQAILNA
ncbi:facilitated trehalose transporter Tret1-like isoform X1 [Tribolium madens]|uniref:facilitated trehalose transporter Tret1-like isoform X1 n=1 Tax=Tribolium madens TaxID=41895 RepID=UPI001CF73A1B|nr:facilitated trehalose transporter Tret1-like isoform X1 [Tribolium madens]XP_044268858.1 facilitated trehalose transporter Tret1-like isoform X1 [Tribolium madens]